MKGGGWFGVRILSAGCSEFGYQDDFNLYAYAYNDPLNRTDPTGKIAGVDDAVILAGALAVGAYVACEQYCGDVAEGIGNAADAVAQGAKGLYDSAKGLFNESKPTDKSPGDKAPIVDGAGAIR